MDKKIKKIYIVTTIESWREKDLNEKLVRDISNGMVSPAKYTRSVGYFETFEDAEKEVINNSCDINEFSYDYCVIEETPPGFYPSVQIENKDDRYTIYHWYKFNYDTKKYEKLDKCPECLIGNKHSIWFGTLG